MYNRILVATDGSELADHAVEQGVALAARLGSEVVFVTVTETWSALEMAGSYRSGDLQAVAHFQAAAAEAATAILDACRARAGHWGVTAKTRHMADRKPAEGIMEAAEAEDCDLIVMATHGRRGVRKMLIGSQTAEVVTLSQRPVLVLR